MSENQTPPGSPPEAGPEETSGSNPQPSQGPSQPPPTPPPPPAAGGPAAPPPPPPATPSTSGGSGAASPNRNIMIVLSYIWILFLVPLLAEKDDSEVQWHAKHGAIFFLAEIALYMILFIVNLIPYAGCLTVFAYPVVWLAALAVRIIAIVKGINGERFLIPGVSEYADRF